MSPTAFLLLFLVTNLADAISLEKVSDKNVTKRNTEFFPDWVPFKNKHGDELGEFIPVPKPKPKKRLALPMNFKLKAVHEPDDDYAQGQAEDGDEYYEKREWSDINRPANDNTPVNHTEISNIDGVVDIITQGPPNAILEAIAAQSVANATKRNLNEKQKQEEAVSEEETNDETDTEEKQSEKPKDEEIATEKPKDEEDVEYDEKNAEEKQPEKTEEQKAKDERKAKILSEVDKLKQRHEEEQRAINEKEKEEEWFREEQERNKLRKYSVPHIHDKYDKQDSDSASSEPSHSDEEYDDEEFPAYNKHSTKKVQRYLATVEPKMTTKTRSKAELPGKLSVFKNPHAYTVKDDEIDETTTTTTKRPIIKSRGRIRHKSGRYSSRFTTTASPDAEETVRISLVPEGNTKAEEPALFFPKVKKNKRKRKKKTTTVAPDSLIAETVADKTAKDLTTAFDSGAGTTGFDTTEVVTGPSGAAVDVTGFDTIGSSTGLDTAPSGSDTTAPSATGVETAPTGTDTFSTNSDAVTDAVPASTDHKHEKKPENHHMEKGGGREYNSEHSEEHSEHGKKAYEGLHKDSKTAKGHHDKEDHHGNYNDHGGHDKHHEVESGHYGDHHHEEHGKKHAKYEESGKHSKGHSTKGSHDIHKKEEYEKKVEFFEEEGDSAEEEKHGGYHNERGHKKGGQFKKGGLDAGHQGHHKGHSGHFAKGGQGHGHKGHRTSGGHDSHGKHNHAKFQEEGHESGKKWIYHHGHPAKTANLIVIDRRADQYYHGPRYFG